MQNSKLFRILLVSVALAVGGSAYAQQPPDVVQSDSFFNTAMGTDVLPNLTPSSPGGGVFFGYFNTGAGYQALRSNTTGSSNSAFGYQALTANTNGQENTATGYAALTSNTSGSQNTAAGSFALRFNTSGTSNIAVGTFALNANTVGNFNTAAGTSALQANDAGSYNTAYGFGALVSNDADNNTAIGVFALRSNTSGQSNTAVGNQALFSNTSGNYNIAIGSQAGFSLTTGSNNIHIGNSGFTGDTNTIRIGVRGLQKTTVIAGIYGIPVSGSPVVVSATGRLGVTVSSERFKTAVSPMGSNTEKLSQLRPVMFHLKTDPKGALQYGLIAEEVAKVYPDLVIRGEKGRIDGVRYDELAPMLLNEVQQLQQRIVEQDAKISRLMELAQKRLD